VARNFLLNSRNEISSKVEQLAIDAGVEGLLQALNSGIVEFELLDVNAPKPVESYFESILGAILSGKTYPLLDDSTGNLIEAALKLGKIQDLGSTVTKSKQAGLSSGLFERLPLFDSATIDEIIDIRKELEKPLVGFRSAIIKFSREIETAQWDHDFSFEVDQVFREKVEPCVLEIEDAYRSNNLLVKLMKSYYEKPFALPATSGFGLLLSAAPQIPDLLPITLGTVAGAAIVGLNAFQEWREKDLELQHNQLYFYYKVKKSLEK
jgi:hypothetical protein